MIEQREADRLIVRYLLGDLPEEEQAKLDERSFVDDRFEEEVGSVADDLIHAFLAGGLSAGDRERFETRFLASPRNIERLELIRDLGMALARDSVPEPRPAPARGRRIAPWLVAAALLLTLAAAALLSRRPPDPPSGHADLPPGTSAPAMPPEAPKSGPSMPDEPRETSLVRLAAPGHDPVMVAVASGTRSVRIVVPVPEDGPPTYAAVVRSASGQEVWRRDDIAPAGTGSVVAMTVPAAVFAGDDYVLALEGETLRSATPTPSRARTWRLRILRPR